MDFTGLSIFEGSGIERITLDGEFDAGKLADRLVLEWIPYFECHKCGRFDYCKFVQRSRYNPDRARDIKCGIVEAALRLFVEKTFPMLEGLSPEQRQNYLDAAFYFEQFLYDAELEIGTYMDRDFVDRWMELGPMFYGHIVRLRDKLNKLAEELRKIPEFHSEQAVLFVEGWSEKAFLDKLRESRFLWFTNLLIDVYSGKGNRRLGKIRMLLERYTRQGYKIFIQGDADGGNKEIFNQIVEAGSVTSNRIFVFEYDFETSIPPQLLLFALQRIGELEDVVPEDFVKSISSGPKPVSKSLETLYGLNINSLKLELASQVGDILNREVIWWQDERFLKTELGRFLQFIQRVF